MQKYYKDPKYVLLAILFISIFMFLVDLPRFTLRYEKDLTQVSWGKYVPDWLVKDKKINIDHEIGGYSLNIFNGLITRDLELKKGLDISGGISVLLEADMSKVAEGDRVLALDSLKNVIERRVNLLGISEANIQTSRNGDAYRILVEIAGVTDPTQAINAIGQVAQLKFKTEAPLTPTPTLAAGEITEQDLAIPNFVDTDLSGADLRKAEVVFDQSGTMNAGAPQIQLQFNTDGTRKFREITEKNIQKRIAIYLDDQVLIDPTVQTAITDGRAIITGRFTPEEAKSLVAQLNGGALPVPVQIVEQRNVGATLGEESVNKSVFAGLIGLGLVIAFMVLYYKKLGFLAAISLTVYALISLAIYKIVPIVLTLPGLTGFILSIGMAVDANILIFERMKEELRAGKPLPIAMENGFGRSWNSIRDANVTTLMTAFILFNPFDWSFLPTSGLVRGFAVTLAIGIFISLFTGVFVTRNLVRVFYTRAPKI